MSDREVAGKKAVSLNRRQVSASETNFDLFCHACADDNKHADAHGFCTDCKEYLCQECIQIHRRVRATRNHAILDKDAMPRDAKLVNYPKDEITEKCSKHPGKCMEYYCETHEDFGCSVCVTLGHKTCEVGYIPELSKDITQSKEYEQLTNEINALHKLSTEINIKSKAAIHDVESKSRTYTDEVTQLGEEIITHVRKLVHDAVLEKDKFVKEMVEGLKSSQNENKNIIEELETKNHSLNAKMSYENQSFVLMKKLKHSIKDMDKSVRKMQMSSKPTIFQFSKISEIMDVKRINRIGTLVKYRKVIKQDESVTISSDEDKNYSFVTGIEVLSDGRVALADHNNKSIKLVEAKKNTVSTMKLNGQPWDLTEVGEGQLAVTLNGKGKIQFLNINRRRLLREIKVDKWCKGVTSYDGKLVVSFNYPGRVQILDIDGRVLREIITNVHGERIFERPLYVEVNPQNSLMYVSDYERHKVICITLEGKLKNIVDDAYGVAADTDGSVFLSRKGSVHHITADGTVIQQVLEPGQTGVDFSLISCDKKSEKMYLVSGILLHVYQLA